MQGQLLFVITAIIITIVIVFVIIHIIKANENKKYRKILRELEREKNLVASTPVALELSKVEPIIKNDKMEEKFSKWQDKFNKIKNNELPKIDDMIIEMDAYIDKKDYKTCRYRLAKIEMEIYKVREHADELLGEIKEITLSEEKYRNIVTKLKAKYRELNNSYQKHVELYDEMQEAVALQLENIEKRFLDFEKAMEKNEYNEVIHVVKALDTMIDHMSIIVEEMPDLLLMGKQLIPKRMKEIKDTVEDMTEKGYPLEYLNIDYNLEESKKNIDVILDKIRVLNLEDCMFELKTILDYLDSLFVDFEKERLSRKVYEEMNIDFAKKLDKVNDTVADIFDKMDDIKKMYDLKEEDVNTLDEVNKVLVVINDDYKNLLSTVSNKSLPYSKLHQELEALTIRLKAMEEDLDKALNSLGNMHDDEVRAREQLDEIQEFLKKCKVIMRSYKLPIITDNYFVELSEANEAIAEVIKELEKKPIVINTLNTRVDTARDLVLKLYKTTDEMMKYAKMAEEAIVYSNRYLSIYTDLEIGLKESSKEFFKGNYKKSLDTTVKLVEQIDPDLYRKLNDAYEK